MTPATERYDEVDHEATTVPSGITSIPPEPPVLPTPAKPRALRWVAASVAVLLVISLCLAVVVGFVVDLAWYGWLGAEYGLGIVAAAGTLGAVAEGIAVAVWRKR